MNFMVQVIIQDLENMGLYPSAVAESEWSAKWRVLKELTPAEYEAVRTACQEGPRAAAWEQVVKSDPDPSKTQRSVAFDSLFGKD